MIVTGPLTSNKRFVERSSKIFEDLRYNSGPRFFMVGNLKLMMKAKMQRIVENFSNSFVKILKGKKRELVEIGQ